MELAVNKEPHKIPDNVEKTEFFDTVDEALTFAAPQGACVYALGVDDTERILRAGYRLVNDPNDADVVLARGGEREAAVARRACRTQKLVLAPTQAYISCAADIYRDADGAFARLVHGAKPCAAVFDESDADQNLASIFGEIAALDLCAFDMTFGARMSGQKPNSRVETEIAELVSKLTAELKAVEKDREASAKKLVSFGKTAARITERYPELLHRSGATQMSEALRMLYAAEERPLGMRGETEMLLSAFVTDFYIKNLNGNGMEFPPDNGRRMDALTEYFGADLRRACLYTAPIYPPLKMRLCEYRRNEFKTEFASKLAALKTRQSAAFRVFKRLYPDDGYGIRTMIDRTDLGICLALAPDVFNADTMLSFLKQAGKLDKYMI